RGARDRREGRRSAAARARAAEDGRAALRRAAADRLQRQSRGVGEHRRADESPQLRARARGEQDARRTRRRRQRDVARHRRGARRRNEEDHRGAGERSHHHRRPDPRQPRIPKAMTMTIDRRFFLKSSGLALVAGGLLPNVFVKMANASTTNGKKTLVAIFQRGAVDGLNVVVPYGEQAYYAARPSIAIPKSDVIDL